MSRSTAEIFGRSFTGWKATAIGVAFLTCACLGVISLLGIIAAWIWVLTHAPR